MTFGYEGRFAGPSAGGRSRRSWSLHPQRNQRRLAHPCRHPTGAPPTAQDQVARKITCFNSKTEEVPLHIDGSPLQVTPGMFVGNYFLVGGGSFGARTVAISRQAASAAFEVTSGLKLPSAANASWENVSARPIATFWDGR